MISLRNSFQKFCLNLILINPGLATSILWIFKSSFFISLVSLLAKSIGCVLLILAKTIDTFVEISLSNCLGGISTFIESRFSGILRIPFLF